MHVTIVVRMITKRIARRVFRRAGTGGPTDKGGPNLGRVALISNTLIRKTCDLRLFLLASSVLGANTAFAQSTTGSDAAVMVAEPSDANSTGDIVVTARKRTETLQTVPTTITAVGSVALEARAVTDLRSLNGFVPNVTVEAGTTSSSSSQVFLRGIGIDNTGFNIDPTVGIYLDDIFVGRLIGSMLGAVDMERIEVLRGPQGTLYGRNSTAGAIKYVTRKPDLSENNVRLAATLGSFDRSTLRGSANVVIVPGKVALLLSGQRNKEDGYIKLVDANGQDTGLRGNGRNVQDYRAALRLLPVDSLTIDIVGDYSHNRSGLQAQTPTNCGALGTRPGTVFSSTSGQFVPGNVSAGQFERCPLFYGDAFTSSVGPFPFDDPKYDSAGIAATGAYDLGSATIKSVTGYRGFRDIFSSNLYGKPSPNLQVALRNTLRQRQFQQEFQLSSNDSGWLGYTLGLFYYHENIKSLYETRIGTATLPAARVNDDVQVTSAYAGYGELYLRPLSGLEVTLGGRISFDDKSVNRAIIASPGASPITYQGKINTTRFTPKLGVSYKFTPDVLGYATYSTGYRSAGWANTNPAALATAALQFGIETETSFEAGLKTQWFDRALTLNLAAFSAKYDNLQAALTVNGQTIVAAADARINGLELEASIRPARGLNIYGNLALMNDKYTTPPPGLFYARSLKHLVRTSYLIGADYSTSLGSLPGSIFFGADFRYQGRAFRNVNNTIDNQSDPYGLLDARFGYRSKDDNWSLSVGGTNLTNKTYYLLGAENQARSYQQPRRYFVTFALDI